MLNGGEQLSALVVSANIRQQHLLGCGASLNGHERPQRKERADGKAEGFKRK